MEAGPSRDWRVGSALWTYGYALTSAADKGDLTTTNVTVLAQTQRKEFADWIREKGSAKDV